jgi:hypothetical protein
MNSREVNSMDIPKELLTDPRFLEVVRLLLGDRPPKETSSASEGTPDDEVTQRVRTKILLRMKKRQTKG